MSQKRTKSQIGKANKNKGARFEREVAKQLFAETGITFRRNLAQTQERDLGDLHPTDSDNFPFLIECKDHSNTINCAPKWELQAYEAAQKAGLIWCVIYKVRGGGIRCRIPLTAIYQACNGSTVTHLGAEVDIQTLAYVAREIMNQP